MSEPEEKNVLSLPELFHAMMAVDGARAYLLGRDNWRRDITDPFGRKVDTLENIDPNLSLAVSRQAKSKGGTWDDPNDWNLWPALHIGLLLPAVGQTLKHYGDSGITLSYKEAARYLSPLPYIVNHCKDYETIKAQYQYDGKTAEQIKTEWNSRLDGYFKNVDMQAPLLEVLKNLPDNLRNRVDIALKHHNAPSAENDNLLGRMILAYLGEKGVAYEKLGIDPRVKDYLRPLHDAPTSYPAKGFYERILDMHVEALPQLIKNVPVLQYDQDRPVPMSEFSSIYRWFGTGKVVEMTKPDLVGAAQLGFTELSALCEKMEMEHGEDFHRHIPLPKNIELFRSAQSSQQLGRLTLVQDIIESTYAGENQGGEYLRQLAKRVWSDDERQQAWGNTELYVPESRGNKRDFTLFRQDMGNIIYSAGLFEERHAYPERGAALKKLALQMERADSLEALGNVIQRRGEVLNDLVVQWEQRYPDSKRTDIARFAQQTFGLAPAKPATIKQEDIELGFEGSQYKADQRKYHIKYREAGDAIETDVLIPKTARKGTFTYDAEKQDGNPVLNVATADGKQLTIPVPARGSYDPFGTTGSPHAGEIVGYGCSVHHASLALMLAELTALGANRESLQGFADKFMAINPGKHHRNMLADFQVEQVWTAFNEGRVINSADYLNNYPDVKSKLLAEPGQKHTQQYLENPNKEPLAASATRARLAYGYGDLYPCEAEKAAKMGARDSWYVTDVDAHLAPTGKAVQWQALQRDTKEPNVDKQQVSVHR